MKLQERITRFLLAFALVCLAWLAVPGRIDVQAAVGNSTLSTYKGKVSSPKINTDNISNFSYTRTSDGGTTTVTAKSRTKNWCDTYKDNLTEGGNLGTTHIYISDAGNIIVENADIWAVDLSVIKAVSAQGSYINSSDYSVIMDKAAGCSEDGKQKSTCTCDGWHSSGESCATEKCAYLGVRNSSSDPDILTGACPGHGWEIIAVGAIDDSIVAGCTNVTALPIKVQCTEAAGSKNYCNTPEYIWLVSLSENDNGHNWGNFNDNDDDNKAVCRTWTKVSDYHSHTKTCTFCGATKTETHDASTMDYEVSTNNGAGTITWTCKSCHHTEVHNIKAKDNDLDTSGKCKKSSTSTTHTWYCQTCETNSSDKKAWSANCYSETRYSGTYSHRMVYQGTDTNGNITSQCSVCGHTITDSHEHDYVYVDNDLDDNGVCPGTGDYHVKKCTICGYVSLFVAKHLYGSAVYDTTLCRKTETCTLCNHVRETDWHNCEWVDDDAVNGVCQNQEGGSHLNVCRNCGTVFVIGDHTLGDKVSDKLIPGKWTQTCTVCRHSIGGQDRDPGDIDGNVQYTATYPATSTHGIKQWGDNYTYIPDEKGPVYAKIPAGQLETWSGDRYKITSGYPNGVLLSRGAAHFEQDDANGTYYYTGEEGTVVSHSSENWYIVKKVAGKSEDYLFWAYYRIQYNTAATGGSTEVMNGNILPDSTPYIAPAYSSGKYPAEAIRLFPYTGTINIPVTFTRADPYTASNGTNGNLYVWRKGYRLTGWESSADGSSIGLGVSTIPTSSTTLNAVWTPETYDLTYHVNTPDNATHNADIATTAGNVTFDTAVTESTLAVPELEGWTFDGWYTNAEGTGDGDIRVSDFIGGTWIFDPNPETEPGDPTTETIQLYAHWVPNTYTVKLMPNRPSISIQEVLHLTEEKDDFTWNSAGYYEAELTYDEVSTLPEVAKMYAMQGWTTKTGWYLVQGPKEPYATNAAKGYASAYTFQAVPLCYTTNNFPLIYCPISHCITTADVL